jgi:hypothetical protein
LIGTVKQKRADVELNFAAPAGGPPTNAVLLSFSGQRFNLAAR